MNTPPHAGSINPERPALSAAVSTDRLFLRGLAILLVVFGHVSRVSFERRPVCFRHSSRMSICRCFFLSGFVRGAPGGSGPRHRSEAAGWQCTAPAGSFRALFAVKVWKLERHTVARCAADPMKCGYWFLPVLFYMFAAWYACAESRPARCGAFSHALLVGNGFRLLAAGFLLRKGSDGPAWFSGLLFCAFSTFSWRACSPASTRRASSGCSGGRMTRSSSCFSE